MRRISNITKVGQKTVEKSTVTESTYTIKYLNDELQERKDAEPICESERQNRFRRMGTKRSV